MRLITPGFFRRIALSLGVVAAASGLLAIYALRIEPNFPRVIRQDVFIEDLPTDLEGLKIVHLSDLHIVKSGKREARALRLIEKIEPDLICLTGDYIGDDGITPGEHSDEDCIREAAGFMAGLSARYGVYGVSGNWDPLTDVPEFEEAGVRMIDNDAVAIKIGDAQLNLASATAVRAGKTFGRPTIVLDHFPYVVESLAHYPVDLVLAGHWHGGQVGWPLKMTDVEYLAGLYEVGGLQLYVTRGLGMHTRMVRFNCPSEVTLIILRRR